MSTANKPVLWFAIFVVTLLTLYAAFTGLAQLHDRRVVLQAAQQNSDASLLPVKGFVARGYRSGTRDISAEAFKLRLLEQAIDRRLLVERIEIEPAARDASAALVARIAVSGPEALVLQYAAALERGQPLVRLTDWRLQRTAAGDGTIRLDGHAVAIWEGA